MQINTHGHYAQTLCWSCKNTHKDKCSWFNPADPQPVPGWVAELRPKHMIGETYMVKECPNYDPEPPRVTVIPGVHRKGINWEAVICIKKERHHLGVFSTYEAAAAARKAAEEALARGEVPAHRGPATQRPCKGVTHHSEGYWQATITSAGKTYYLGIFKDKEDAVAARLAAEEAIARGEEPKRKKPKRKEPPPKKANPPGHCIGVRHDGRRWTARIKHKGHVYHLGSFKIEEQAIAARKAAEEAIKRGEAPCRNK